MVRQAVLAAGLMMAWQVAAKATRDSLFLSVFEPSALPAMTGAAAVCSILMALLSMKLLRRFGPFRVHVAKRNQLELVRTAEFREVAPALAADAKTDMAQLAVRRTLRQQIPRDKRRDSRRGSQRFEK